MTGETPSDEDDIFLGTRPAVQRADTGPITPHGLHRRRPRAPGDHSGPPTPAGGTPPVGSPAIRTPSAGVPAPSVITPTRPDLVAAREQWFRRMAERHEPSSEPPNGRRRAADEDAAPAALSGATDPGTEPTSAVDDEPDPYLGYDPFTRNDLGERWDVEPAPARPWPAVNLLHAAGTSAGTSAGSSTAATGDPWSAAGDPLSTPAAGPSPGALPPSGVYAVRRGVRYERRRVSAVLPAAVAVVGLAALLGVQQLVTRPEIERLLTDRAVHDLQAAGLAGIQVRFTGRDAVLTGTLTSPDEAGTARSIVARITGVRTVELDTTAPGPTPTTPATTATLTASPTTTAPTPTTTSPSAAPTIAAADLAEVSATVDRGQVILAGTVADDATSAAIRRAVRKAFATKAVDDRITVAAGAPQAGTGQFAALVGAFGQQSAAGAVTLRGGRVTLAGAVPTAAVRTAVLTAAAAIVGSDAGRLVDHLAVAPQANASRVGEQLTALAPVTFAGGSTTIDGAGRGVIAQVVAVLQAHRSIKVRIEGYTDAQGDAAGNLTLSQRRADAVLSELTAQGIAASRLTAQGFGEADPIAPGDTPAAMALNRRVVFVPVA